MRVLHTFVRVLLFILSQTSATKVAIVGGGVGGAATSYYLRKNIPGVEISLFEQSERIGGRLKHITIDGKDVNVGGDAFSIVNEYLVQITQDLSIKLDTTDFEGNGRSVLWDGKNFFEITTPAWSSIKLYYEMELMRYHLWLNYEERGSKPFRTIDEFLSFGGLSYYGNTSSKELAESVSLDESFLWDTWEPISRVIYDQGLSCNAFAGIVSLLSAVTDSYSILGGNDLLVKSMLDYSKANIFLSSSVSEITKSINGTYQLTLRNNKKIKTDFDHVVIAAPIEFANITFVNIKTPQMHHRPYRHWFVTVVSAKAINPTYFGKSTKDIIPDIILTPSNSTAPFVVISPMANATLTNHIIYKSFSNIDISSYIPKLFIDVSQTYVEHWPYTFPDLSPSDKYQPFLLDESSSNGLIYLNSIESLATAMEASTLAGRNAALLI